MVVDGNAGAFCSLAYKFQRKGKRVQRLIGHRQPWQRLEQIWHTGRWPGALLVVGKSGIGKHQLARQLAQGLLCLQTTRGQLLPCWECESCKQFTQGIHPDYHLVSKPADRATLPVELLIGPPDNRLRAGLCFELGMKPSLSKRKLAVIDDADSLAEEGANALLKTLEEPPPGALIVLNGTSAQRQLPTIRSRCQVLRVEPLSADEVAQVLMQTGHVDSAEQARSWAERAEGSVAQAIELAQPEWWAARGELQARLSARNWDAQGLSSWIQEVLDKAGSEASEKRQLLKRMFGFVLELHAAALREQLGLQTDVLGGNSVDPTLATAARRVAQNAMEESLERQLERTQLALAQVDRNAHLPTLIDAWLDDLSQLAQGKPTALAWLEG